MSKVNLALALVVLMAVSLSCTFLKDKVMNEGKPASGFDKAARMPLPDLKGRLTSPGSVIVHELAKIDPTIAQFAEQIEANERGAMTKIIEANPASPTKDDATTKPSPKRGSTTLASLKPGPLQPPAAAFMMFQAGNNTALPGFYDGMIVGMLAGMFKGMFAEVPATNYHKNDSKTETSEGTTTTMDVEIGIGEDGSTTFGMGQKTEAIKNGVKVTTEMHSTIDGQDCPNAEGQVPITVKMHLSGRSGNSGYTQDVTAFIRLIVDDDAEVASGTIDVTQATGRGRSGQETYVETGHTIKFRGVFEDSKTSNERIVQKTDNATQADVDDASTSGANVAYGAAVSAIILAKNSWQGGKCVQIEATSPGKVDPGSRTAIPVKVTHKKDGSEVHSKLEATLDGEASIDPNVIPRTPATLVYAAPGETGKTATIKLKATSRRGIATLDLTASTGEKSYHAEGSSQGAFFKGDICALDKHFTINVNSKTGKWPMEFTPENESAGRMEGTYTGSGCTLTGGGPYTVSIGPNGSGTLTFTYNSTASCPGLAPAQTSRTSTIALTPAPDLKCP